MTQRRNDKEKFERADRESRIVLDAERLAREEKTARLRELRLRHEASASQSVPAKGRRPAKKPAKKTAKKTLG